MNYPYEIIRVSVTSCVSPIFLENYTPRTPHPALHNPILYHLRGLLFSIDNVLFLHRVANLILLGLE